MSDEIYLIKISKIYFFKKLLSIRLMMQSVLRYVRYITHDSCAISVVPPFNRL